MMTQEDVLKLFSPDYELSDEEKVQFVEEYVGYELSNAPYEVKVPMEDIPAAMEWGQRKFFILLMRDSNVFCFSNERDAELMKKHWGE